MQTSAGFRLHRLEHRLRLEALAGEDHGGAVGHAGQVAEHHAEAVVERHRDAEPVAAGEAHGFAHEEAVVEDVVVGERRPFRRAGGARGELDVDRLVELQPGFDVGQCRQLGGVGRRQQRVEVQHARRRLAAEPDHVAQLRQPGRGEGPGSAVPQFRHHVEGDGEVIAGLEGRREDQGCASHLVEHVFEFRAPVGRIDVDHDQSGARGRELHQHPFRAVLRPDADAVAGTQAEPQQAGGQAGHAGVEFGVAPAHALVGHDQGVVAAVAGGDRCQEGADGLADQRDAARAVYVAQAVVHVFSMSISGLPA